MDKVKDDEPPEGFDEGVMALAAAVAALLSVGAVERRAK
jgi:Glu-tRNA(Gln) amidotransferase subunit E-like FAD-binding protein